MLSSRGIDLQQQLQQSPRSSPLRERKRGTRVADLENKLSKAQEELKKLRDQLASADVAKVDAEEALEKAKKQVFTAHRITEANQDTAKMEPTLEPEPEPEPKSEFKNESSLRDAEISEAVSGIVVPVESPEEQDEHNEEGGKEKDCENENEEAPPEEQLEEKSPEIMELKATILEKEKQVELLLEENMIFKRKSEEQAAEHSAAARAKEEQLQAKVNSLEEELKGIKATATRVTEQLAAAEGAKATVEAEMKRLRVQTEQWRKAAEAATALLASGDAGFMEMGGRRVAQRCRSMDKHIGGFVGWGSQMIDDESEEDGAGGGKWKAARSRMFGDLWRKKMQQHK